MLGGGEREHSRAAERSLIIECTIAIEPSADFDSPKMPNQALQRTPPSHHCCNRDPTGPATRNKLQQGAYTVYAGGNLTHETSAFAGRVIRGGSWHGAPHVVTAARLIWQQPSQRESSLGFRVALAPQLSRQGYVVKKVQPQKKNAEPPKTK